MNDYVADGLLSSGTGILAGISLGVLQNAIDILILAGITGIVIPLVRWGFSEIIKLLYKKGLIPRSLVDEMAVSIDEQIKFLEDKLHKAIDSKNEEVVKFLKEEIINLKKEDDAID